MNEAPRSDPKTLALLMAYAAAMYLLAAGAALAVFWRPH
jgi:hypothetical protein